MFLNDEERLSASLVLCHVFGDVHQVVAPGRVMIAVGAVAAAEATVRTAIQVTTTGIIGIIVDIAVLVVMIPIIITTTETDRIVLQKEKMRRAKVFVCLLFKSILRYFYFMEDNREEQIKELQSKIAILKVVGT